MSIDSSPSVADFLAELPEPVWYTCSKCGEQTAKRSDPCWACLRHASETRDLKAAAEAYKQTLAEIPGRFAWATSLDHALIRTRVKLRSSTASMRALLSQRQLVLYGPHSKVGKTTLAVALMHEWAKKVGQFAAWVPSRRLATCRSETKFGEVPALLAVARSAPLVILDDLGNEYASSVNDIRALISDRVDGDAPLWITTAYDRPELVKRLGPEIVERIFDGAYEVHLGPPKDKAPAKEAS